MSTAWQDEWLERKNEIYTGERERGKRQRQERKETRGGEEELINLELFQGKGEDHLILFLSLPLSVLNHS